MRVPPPLCLLPGSCRLPAALAMELGAADPGKQEASNGNISRVKSFSQIISLPHKPINKKRLMVSKRG